MSNTSQPRRAALPAAALAIMLAFILGGCAKTEESAPAQSAASMELSPEVYSYAVVEKPELLTDFENAKRISESMRETMEKMAAQLTKTGQNPNSVEAYRKQFDSLKMVNAKITQLYGQIITDFSNAMREQNMPPDLLEKLQKMESDAETAKQAKAAAEQRQLQRKQQAAAMARGEKVEAPPPEPLVLKPSGAAPVVVGEAAKTGGNTLKPSGSGTGIIIQETQKQPSNAIRPSR